MTVHSIIIEKAEPDGIGALAASFEQLKKKLGEEGLFPRQIQANLATFPKNRVITSPADDASEYYHDGQPSLSKNYPTKVQGWGAAQVADHIRLCERSDLVC